MNKYRLEFMVNVYSDNFSQSSLAMERLIVKDLTFFQLCVILGGLQCLCDEAKAES